MKLKDLCATERPREKMFALGSSALGNAELLAILLRSGTRERSALELASDLLVSCDGRLGRLFGMSADKLTRMNGIGDGKAATLIACMELGRRFLLEESSADSRPFVTPRMVYDHMIPLLKGIDHEECWILFLNEHNYLTGKMKLTSGSGNATIMDVRQVLRMALENNAAGIFLVHNHPTGNPEPSKADIAQTGRLHDGLMSVGIHLVDHVIISDRSFYSFSDECTRKA